MAQTPPTTLPNSPAGSNAPGPSATPYQGDDQPDKGTVEQPGAGDLTLERGLELYDDAKKYVDTGPRKRWDNYFKVYMGRRVIRNYEGVSDPVNREAHTIIETLVSNIAGGDISFHFVKTNEEQTDDTEVLNGMLDYYMECNHMDLKNQEWVREMLLYGTGILHITWRDGKPFIENIPLRDFFVDPTSTGLVETVNPASYAGFGYLASRDSLKRQQIYDAAQKQYVPKYDLAKLALLGDGDSATSTSAANTPKLMDKKFKDMFNTSTLGDSAVKDQVFMILLYHLPTGKIMEIGNREQILYYEDTYLQRDEKTQTIEVEVEGQMVQTTRKLDKIDPFLPFAVLRDYIDSSLFYGEGEMAVIMQDVEMLNDYESMDMDNNAYQNTPMYWIDPQFADLAPELETIPGAVYPIPRNAMGPIPIPQIAGDLDAKKGEIMDRMRRSTAADEAVQGVSQQQGRITATEISTQVSQAQNRFSTKIQNLESEGFAQLATVIFKMVQIFVTTKTAIRIVGKEGVYFKDYDPWEFNGEWEPHVELDSTIQKKNMEVGQKLNQAFEYMKNNPIFNPVEVGRYILQNIDDTLSDEEFNKMLQPPPPPPKDKVSDFLQVSYKDLEPWGRYQAQKDLNWEPDPSLMGDMHNRMIEQGVKGVDMMDPGTDAEGNVVPGLEPPPAEAAAPPDGMPSGALAGASA